MRTIVLLCLALLLSGCVSARGPVVETTCSTGHTGLFLKVREHDPNAMEQSERNYYVDRARTLFHVRGGFSEDNGSGQVYTHDAELYGVESDDVKAEMQRGGFYDSGKDFRVAMAWKAVMPPEDFDQLCDLAGAPFYRLQDEYKPTSGDACVAWTEINANTQRGDKTVREWCEAAPAAFNELDSSFSNIVDRNRMRAGIPA